MGTNDDLEKAMALADAPEEGGKFLDINNAVGSSPKNRFITYTFMAGAFFLVFVAILVLCLVFRADYRTLQAEHDERMELINYAEEYASCKLKGTVTGLDFDETTGRYAFTYRVVSESDAVWQLDGVSPAIYEKDDITNDYPVGQSVWIAVKSGVISQNSESINMSYADYDMMNYPPYKKAKVGFVTFVVATSVCFFIVCCFSGLGIFALREKRREKVGEDEKVEVVKPNGTRKK